MRSFTLPAPKVVIKPMLWLFLTVRGVYWYLRRLFIAEPLFKAYCTSVGRRVRTDIHIPYITGKGEIHVGDDVTIDGRLSVKFARRYVDRPALRIGNYCGVGSGCVFVVGKAITIGNHVLIGGNVEFRDVGGHASDPVARMEGKAANDENAQPIVVQDNVWIGAGAMLMPGTHVGEGSIVAARAVVSGNVAPYTIVAGSPARRIGKLEPPPEALPQESVE